MPAVPGLKDALRQYESDKVKDREAGAAALRAIFGNRENLDLFAETAGREGGAGWTALFQALFQTVIKEKRAVIKANATAQADRRLSDAVGLVRFVAERAVYLLSRKPLQSLVRHMRALLVHSSSIFPPTVRDYAKALRTLLSYPPHLENMEEVDWKNLMNICWASALGDKISDDRDREDEESGLMDEDGEEEEMEVDDSGPNQTNGHRQKISLSQASIELVALIPLLLSTPSASLLPSIPQAGDPPINSLGYSILLKAARFLEQYPTPTSTHTNVIRSCNLVLAELELNSRVEVVQAGSKLLPALVSLWSARDKLLREQVLITLRILLPWITHDSVSPNLQEAVRANLERLVEGMAKEGTIKASVDSIDLSSVRLCTYRHSEDGSGKSSVFNLSGVQPGHGFSYEQAFIWASFELYATCLAHLSSKKQLSDVNGTAADGGRSNKRRKTEGIFDTLLSALFQATISAKIRALQILMTLIHQHGASLPEVDFNRIRSAAFDALDSDDEVQQSWALLLLSVMSSTKGLGGDVNKVWQTTIRKINNLGTSRAAAFCAQSILHAGQLSSDIIVKDIGNLLKQVDIQGPPHPYDSVCSFLCSILEIAHADIRLYSLGLDERVMSWLEKQDMVDGPRGRSRMDANFPLDISRLLSAVTTVSIPHIPDIPVETILPECPNVERILEEERTDALRMFVLKGEVPQLRTSTSGPPNIATTTTANNLSGTSSEAQPNGSPEEAAETSSLQIRACEWLKRQVDGDLQDRKSQPSNQLLRSPERGRKSLDLAVLSILYAGGLQYNHLIPPESFLERIRDLIQIMILELSSGSSILNQFILWRSFLPLLKPLELKHPVWPIFLNAHQCSGIRPDLLPAPAIEPVEQSSSELQNFLGQCWKLPRLEDILNDVLKISRQLVDQDTGEGVLGTPNQTPSTQMPPELNDDDDFGEIRDADTDAMPVSKEASQSQRISESLVRLLVLFRLSGTISQSETRLATSKHADLLNAFLAAEGFRFLQLGHIVCDMVKNSLMILGKAAINAIIERLEEALSTYAYAREEKTLLLVFHFLQCTADIWNHEAMAGHEITQRIMNIAQHIVKKVVENQVQSWRVRLASLVFMDDYLDYDDVFHLWTRHKQSDDEPSPPLAIRDRMKDPDIRVRFRAATSTAGLLYLPDLPESQHLEFYIETMQGQPGLVDHWNLFLTDMLWKLNCCIASAAVRSAALFHLYEIPIGVSNFDLHLERGLQAVIQRLGIGSLATLWSTYSSSIVERLLSLSNDPGLLAPRICGYEHAASRAKADLTNMGADLLANGRLTYFNTLCEAAGLLASDQSLRLLHPTIARIMADSKKITVSSLTGQISSLPCSGKLKVERILKQNTVEIAVEVMSLIGKKFSPSEIALSLEKLQGSDSNLFNRFTINTSFSTLPLDAGESNLDQVLSFLLGIAKEFDPKALCLNCILDGFNRLGTAILAPNRVDILVSISAVIALYPSYVKDSHLLQTLLFGTVGLLDQGDVASNAFQLVDWALETLPQTGSQHDSLSNILTRLGRARLKASPQIASSIDILVYSRLAKWNASDHLWAAIEQASILWPEDMRHRLGPIAEPELVDLTDLLKSQNSSDAMIICEKYHTALKNDQETGKLGLFARQAFWNMKSAFHGPSWTREGASAFLDCLAAVDGQIEAADLEVAQTLESQMIAGLAYKFRADQATLVQVLTLKFFIMLADDEDHKIRSTSQSVLRQLSPHISDIIGRRHLAPEMTKGLDSLRSPIPPSGETKTKARLDSLNQDVFNPILSQPEGWVTNLATALIDVCSVDNTFFACLSSAMDLKLDIMIDLLPLLVQAFLSFAVNESKLRARQACLEAIFHSALQDSSAASRILYAIIRVALHLRNYMPLFSADPIAKSFWMHWDYLLLAEGAVKLGSFATALLFLEIAKSDAPKSSVDLFDPRVQNIMLAVYSNINDPDGFYGLKTHNVKDSLRRRLDHEGQHLRSFGVTGSILESATSSQEISRSLIASAGNLHAYGLHRAAASITESIRGETEAGTDDEDLSFEVAWRTGNWDLPIRPDTKTSSSGAFYSALRAVHRERKQSKAIEVVNTAIKAEMLHLQEIGNERMMDLQKTVDNLLCLRELSSWLGSFVQTALMENDFQSSTIKQFSDTRSSSRYALAERLNATRRSLISSAQDRESRTLLGDLISPTSDGLRHMQIQTNLQFSAYAREEGNMQAAMNAITAVQHLEGHTMSDAAADEYGAVLWMQNEHSLALQLVEESLESLQINVDAGGKETGRIGLLMGKIAHWSHLARLLPLKNVQEMFDSAYKLLSKHKVDPADIASMSHDYAIFAAEQQAVQRTSPELVLLREYKTRKESELTRIKNLSSTQVSRQDSKSLKAATERITATLEEDLEAIKNLEHGIDTLTKSALKMFAYALRYSNKFDDSVTKMCALWLAYGDPKEIKTAEEKRADGISRYIASAIEDIPSHKFIFLGPQLAARLYRPKAPTTFNSSLNGLLLRLGREHPYHILYQIIPLAHGVSISASRPRKSMDRVPDDTANTGRGPAAKEIMAVLDVDQMNPTARTAGKQMTAFAEAAMPWCLVNPPESEGKVKQFPVDSTSAIMRLKELDIPIATVVPPVILGGKYDNIPKFKRYSAAYSVLGGLHRPKKMKVYDTLGKDHYQLFKGEDEIRQDAVMEQVFSMTNNILARDRQTKIRKLNFRTYTVIPLANKTGILEFVAEGVSIGDWLKPAHERYRSKDPKSTDIKSHDFRDEISKIQNKDWKSPKLKVVWEELIQRFKPVLRHFFMEKQREPMNWFSMRLNYSRSVAVSSMVGWILGIGDRHLSNIMIDQHNGELIQIDFGIVFEEGASLRIPERVPFRLTNDIVDGFGITGVDGTFRRCSEQSLRVLRENTDLIMTVLEVFKHDPLYSWGGDSHEKTSKKQQGDDGFRLELELQQSANVMEKADRVLGRIRSKLRDELSVEYTVNMLIQEARNTEHLAMIYHGWHSWF